MIIFIPNILQYDVPADRILLEILDELVRFDHKDSGLVGRAADSRSVVAAIDEIFLSKEMALEEVGEADALKGGLSLHY